MKVKDQRIKMMNEILNGIRVLKLYAWEMAFIRSITHIREKELGYIRQKAIISAVSSILSTFTPILVSMRMISFFVSSRFCLGLRGNFCHICSFVGCQYSDC